MRKCQKRLGVKILQTEYKNYLFYAHFLSSFDGAHNKVIFLVALAYSMKVHVHTCSKRENRKKFIRTKKQKKEKKLEDNK